MERTYDIVSVATAIANNKRLNEVSAQEKLEFSLENGLLERSDALVGVEGRLSAVRSELYGMKVDRLKLQLDYLQNRDKLAMSLVELGAKQAYDDKANIAKQIEKISGQAEKLMENYNDTNTDILRALDQKRQALRVTKTAGRAELDALLALQPTVEEKFPISLRKAGHPMAMATWLDEINETQPEGKKIFDKDPETNVIRNIEQLKGPDSPLKQLGLGDGAIENIFGIEDNLFEDYNRKMSTHHETIKRAQQNIQDMREGAELIRASDNIEDFSELFEAAKDDITLHEEQYRKGGMLDHKNKKQLLEEVKLYESGKRSVERLEKLAKKLVQEDPDAATQINNTMARRMASPYVREWARDNGFDELGYVKVEDGVYDPSTYIPGRDDLAVVRAFNRQAGRGSGRYGFKSIGTGDIVQATVDGEDVFGERMKIHAADPVGMVRIMTEDGEIVTLMPGDTDQIVVLDRKPDQASPLEKKAKGRAFIMGNKIRAAADAARAGVPGSEVNVQITNDGFIVVDRDTGRNIDENEYQQAVDSFLSLDGVSGKVVDNKQYLVSNAEGTMFEYVTDESGVKSLVPVDDTNLMQQIQTAPARRVVTQDEETEENKATKGLRIASRTDIGTADPRFVFEPLSSDDNYPGDEQAKDFFDNLDGYKRAGVSLADLQYEKSEMPFSATAGQTYVNRRTIGGMTFVDLDQPPPKPPSEFTEGAPARVKIPTDPRSEAEESIQEFGDTVERLSADPPGPSGVDALGLKEDQKGEVPSVRQQRLASEQERRDRDKLIKDRNERIRVGSIIARWNSQATINQLKGKPPPRVPEGFEVVQGEGLREIEPEPPAEAPTAPTPEPQLDMTGVDIDAIAKAAPPATEPEPEPEPEPKPEQKPEDVPLQDLVSGEAENIEEVVGRRRKEKQPKPETPVVDQELPEDVQKALASFDDPDKKEPKEEPKEEPKKEEEPKDVKPDDDEVKKQIEDIVGKESKGEISEKPITQADADKLKEDTVRQTKRRTKQLTKTFREKFPKPGKTKEQQALENVKAAADAALATGLIANLTESNESDQVSDDAGIVAPVIAPGASGPAKQSDIVKQLTESRRLRQAQRERDAKAQNAGTGE